MGLSYDRNLLDLSIAPSYFELFRKAKLCSNATFSVFYSSVSKSVHLLVKMILTYLRTLIEGRKESNNEQPY